MSRELSLSGANNQYLQKEIGDVLVEGLMEVCQKVPRDPIDYLARYILHKAKQARMEAEEAKRLEELQRMLEEAEAERRRQADCWEEQKRIMEADAMKRREIEAEQRRKQQLIDAMRRRNEKEWRQDLMQYADLTTQEISIEGVRTIVGKANPDFASKTEAEIVEECDFNKDGIISYDDMKNYLQEKFKISVAPWEAGHVPTLQRLKEEDESAISRDARGRSELHRLVATSASNASEMIEKLLAEDHVSLTDRDADGLTPRELAANEGIQENVQAIDRVVLKWIFDGIVNGQTSMLDALILSGYSWFPSASSLMDSQLFTPDQVETFGPYVEEVQSKRNAFFQAISENNLASIEAMLNSDRRLLSARDSRGLEAIHIATSDKKTEVIKFLRATYASAMNAHDALGRTAITVAQTITGENERDSIIKLLTEQGVTFAEGNSGPQQQSPEGAEHLETE